MLRLRMCAFARRIKCWSTLTAAAAGLATTAVHADYSFDSSFLEIGGGNASSEVADVVPAVPGGAIEGGEAAGVEGSRAALAGEVSGAADVPSVAAAEPPRAFAPHEAEVAGRALYANGEEETLV